MILIDMDKLRQDMVETLTKGVSIAATEVFDTIWEQEKVNAIVISKGATNGDMIKLLFQNFLFIPCEKHNLLQMLLYEDNENQKGLITSIEFDLDWWNSSYEGEKE